MDATTNGEGMVLEQIAHHGQVAEVIVWRAHLFGWQGARGSGALGGVSLSM